MSFRGVKILEAGLLAALVLCCPRFAASAQTVTPVTCGQGSVFDVFVPISKYLGSGDADKLSAWFSNSVEVSILGESNTCSRSQARQILKSFYSSYTPRSFEITHEVSQANANYAVGHLKAGGETFLVTIFLCMKDNCYDIHQLKIEKL